MKNRSSLFQHQSRIYGDKRDYDVNHRGMEMIWNNKLSPSLNLIKGKISPFISKGILRHCHYRSDPKLGAGIVEIRRTPCSSHACITILSLYWY